jgi:hypothetical protein
MSSIKLELTPDHVDVILSALGEQPFIKVHELITLIRQQAVPQWEAIQKAQSSQTPEKELT